MPVRDKTLTTFGQNVARLRDLRGISQDKLAEKADLDLTYLGGIERGVRNPGVKTLVRLAKALNFGNQLPPTMRPWSNAVMPVQFKSIKRGSEWDRNELAELWGYKSFHAIARGVVTPADEKLIVLFVTEEKQESLTQYDDRLDGKLLYWEGEDGHANDERIANAANNGDEIHVFYRSRHHSPFTYLGEVHVKSAKLLSNKRSEFEFAVSPV